MSPLRPVVLTLAALLAGPALSAPKANVDARAAAPASRAPIPEHPPGAAWAVVASRDARTGAPTLLLAGPETKGTFRGAGRLATPETAARFWLTRQAPRYALTPKALDDARVERVVPLRNGSSVVTFRQRVDGVELFHSDVKVLLDAGLDLVAIGGHPHPSAVPGGKKGSFRRSATQAVADAVRDLEGLALSPGELRPVTRPQADDFYALQDAAAARVGLSFVEPARVRRVYFPLPDRLVPAHFVELLVRRDGAAADDAYDYVLSAEDGALLYRQNLTRNAAFSYRVYADASGSHRPWDGPLSDFTPHPTGVPDGSFPGTVAPNLISLDGFNVTQDPWLAAGATETRGNNVDAYTDDDAPDGFSSGDLRAAVSSAGTFDYVYDLDADPQANGTQKMAALTNLFYVTNWLHDWWYDSGFTEAAGNAQQSNYGRGGVEGDPLHAEAQDGAPGKLNNSNMTPMADGTSPKMQMYLWDGRVDASLLVQPAGLGFAVGTADFGPASFSVSGALVLAADGTAPASDACEALTNDVTGKVALVDRGTCSFKLKALNVQKAGGIGMVLADNQVASSPPGMGNDPDVNKPITIPLVSVTQAAGDTLRSELGAGPVTASLSRSTGPLRDGDLDASIIAHEWGHYLHMRQVACGSQQCGAQSEGWGDFVALQLLLREGDDLDGAFPMAVHATAGLEADPGYFGIRRYPYSVDFTKNPLTFRHISRGEPLPTGVPISTALSASDNSEVHAAGEVWTSMLFEGFVALLKDAQGPSSRYSFEEARRRMSDYVEGGLQLAPADPTFTEQRDAIIATAAAADLEDARLLAEAFARRGAGTCAVSPARDSTDFSGVVEDFGVRALLTLTDASLDDGVSACDGDGILDAEETGVLKLTFANAGGTGWSGTVTVSTTAAGVSFPQGAEATFSSPGAGSPAEATLQVALDGTVSPSAQIPFHLELSPSASCADGVTAFDVVQQVDFDVALASSATDEVEATPSTWNLAGDSAEEIWSRAELTPGEHVWKGVDYPAPTDTSLVSPPLQVSASDPLVLTFDAAYQFEKSGGTNWDGAVLEVSEDDGATWVDASTYGNPGYGGTIGDGPGGAVNALDGRQGWVGQNASYPQADTLTVDLGTALAGKTIRVRFRIGSDDAAGAAGLQLDHLAFAGITNTPFATVVAEDGVCAPPPDGGSTDAGTDAGTTDAGTSDAGSSDAGTTDAGTSDAGTTDGGTSDAGSSDAGSSDAGTSDGGVALGDGGTQGPRANPPVSGGCGCRAGDPGFGSTLPFVALVGLFWLRRRRLQA